MKRIVEIFIVFGITFIMVFSCGKDEKLQNNQKENILGMVLYFGDPAVDGCGWLIKIDSLLCAPTNLDSEFKKDSLKVILDYDILSTTWNCGWRKPGYTQINIKRIKIQ